MFKLLLISSTLAIATCSHVDVNSQIDKEVDGTFIAIENIETEVNKIENESNKQKQKTPLKIQVDKSIPLIKQNVKDIKVYQENIKELVKINVQQDVIWDKKYEDLKKEFQTYKDDTISNIFKWLISISLLGIPVGIGLTYLFKSPKLLLISGLSLVSSVLFGALYKYFATMIFYAAIGVSGILIIGLIYTIYYFCKHKDILKDIVKTTDKQVLLDGVKEETKKVINKIKK